MFGWKFPHNCSFKFFDERCNEHFFVLLLDHVLKILGLFLFDLPRIYFNFLVSAHFFRGGEHLIKGIVFVFPLKEPSRGIKIFGKFNRCKIHQFKVIKSISNMKVQPESIISKSGQFQGAY
jgi:hypothetical protein